MNCTNSLIFSLAILMLSATAPAQKIAPQKFNDAIKRSHAAADVVARLAELSENGIPKELIDRAEAIGVFPCKKTDLLLEHAVICPGVMSRHLQRGWSAPAFYRFGGGGLGRPDSALSGSSVMILIFMDKQSVDWLSKSLVLKKEKEARAGILGPLTREQIAELATDTHIIAYSIRKDGLRGENLSSGFWKGVGLGEDNNINKGLYGIKGVEVLLGREIASESVPVEVFTFQQALQKHYSR